MLLTGCPKKLTFVFFGYNLTLESSKHSTIIIVVVFRRRPATKLLLAPVTGRRHQVSQKHGLWIRGVAWKLGSLEIRIRMCWQILNFPAFSYQSAYFRSKIRHPNAVSQFLVYCDYIGHNKLLGSLCTYSYTYYTFTDVDLRLHLYVYILYTYCISAPSALWLYRPHHSGGLHLQQPEGRARSPDVPPRPQTRLQIKVWTLGHHSGGPVHRGTLSRVAAPELHLWY